VLSMIAVVNNSILIIWLFMVYSCGGGTGKK